MQCSGSFQIVQTRYGLSLFILLFTNDEFIKTFDLQIYKNQRHISFYYKVGQALLETVTVLIYYEVGQLLLQFFCITNWDKAYYKVGQILPNGVAISKQGNFHDKLGQVLQSRAVQYFD